MKWVLNDGGKVFSGGSAVPEESERKGAALEKQRSLAWNDPEGFDAGAVSGDLSHTALRLGTCFVSPDARFVPLGVSIVNPGFANVFSRE